MEIVGRLTANATVNKVKGDRQVVNFSVAVNDRYKPKEGEPVEVTTFFNCSYWISTGIAGYLLKGTVVELSGRVSVNAWKNMEGEAKAGLNVHVNSIKLHGKPAGNTAAGAGKGSTNKSTAPVEDDLPF